MTNKIKKYIKILNTPNKAIGNTTISKLAKKRIDILKSIESPDLRLNVLTKHIYIKLQDDEWLDLDSPEYCLRYSTVVLKYPEIYVKI